MTPLAPRGDAAHITCMDTLILLLLSLLDSGGGMDPNGNHTDAGLRSDDGVGIDPHG